MMNKGLPINLNKISSQVIYRDQTPNSSTNNVIDQFLDELLNSNPKNK